MPVHEAWAALLEANVHHLPVMRDGEVLGVLTDTDLLKHTSQGPVAVLRLVDKLPGRESLPGYSRKVTEMVAALLAGRPEPGGHRRLRGPAERRAHAAHPPLGRGGPGRAARSLRLARARVGGAQEQTLLTDQDNALVFADEGASPREYFTALADRANTDLSAAGFPRCPGGYMARNHCGTLSEWRDRFAGWVGDPSRRGRARGRHLLRLPAGGRLARPRAAAGRARRHPAPRRPSCAAWSGRPSTSGRRRSLLLRLRERHRPRPQAAGHRPGGLPGPLLRARGGEPGPQHAGAAATPRPAPA